MKKRYLLYHGESDCLWEEHLDEDQYNSIVPGMDGCVDNVTGIEKYELIFLKEKKNGKT